MRMIWGTSTGMSERPPEFACESRSEAETISLGERLGRVLEAGDWVALHGELGAGKTRFVRGLAAGMGLNPADVCSPTFVLMNEYSRAGGEPALIHVDAYRMSGPDELETLGLDAAAAAPAVIVVEWAERLPGAAPEHVIDVEIQQQGGDARRILIRATPEMWRRIRGALGA